MGNMFEREPIRVVHAQPSRQQTRQQPAPPHRHQATYATVNADPHQPTESRKRTVPESEKDPPAKKPKGEFEADITPNGGKINFEDETGMSLSIPENATDQKVGLSLAISLSQASEMPDNVDPVSPVYVLEIATEIKFRKEVEMKLQHTANLQTAEDCKDMVVLMSHDSSPALKFEEMEGGSVEFHRNGRFGMLKMKSLFSSSFKIGRKKREGCTEEYYSARLYRDAVVGCKVSAVFSMCLEHPVYTKHCDKMIAMDYPKVSDKSKGIFTNALIINSDQVSLINVDNSAWEVEMDLTTISKLEVDTPKRTKQIDNNYQPRICVDLKFTSKETPVPLELKVTGLKDGCSFTIQANELLGLPYVNTDRFKTAIEMFMARVSKESDSPLVTCAKKIGQIMIASLHQFRNIIDSAKSLMEMVMGIQKTLVVEKSLFEGITVITAISNKFKRLSPLLAKQLSSAGSPKSWLEVVEDLMATSIDLMKSIQEMLGSTKALLHEDPRFPGFMLSEPPKEVTITQRGKEISHDGMSLSIPKNVVANQSAEIVLATSLSGASRMPEGVQSVSPTYLAMSAIEFSEDVSMKLQHSANLCDADAYKDLVILKADISLAVHLGSDSSPLHKFEEIKDAEVEFSQEGRVGVLKLRKSLHSSYRIGKKREGSSSIGEEMFYSARLYKAIVGYKVSAVFCMCPENPVYTKYCDKIIGHFHPENCNSKPSCKGALIIYSNEVALVKSEKTAEFTSWELNCNRWTIRKAEINSPERMDIEMFELNDYPPRICADLSPPEERSAPANLKVVGLKDSSPCDFNIYSDRHLPSVNTDIFMSAAKDLEANIIMKSDSSLVMGALDMLGIMYEIEPVLKDPDSITLLVEKVKEICDLLEVLDDPGLKVNFSDVIGTVLHKEIESVTSGNYETWLRAIDALMNDSINLMTSAMKLIGGKAPAAISVGGFSIRSLYLIKWSEGEYRLINHVGYKWVSFGTRLGIEQGLLNAWKEECRENPLRCWIKVMDHWIASGSQDYEATWEGMYQLLEDVDCTEIAKKLKKVVSAVNKT